MNNFLNRIVVHALDRAAQVQPRIPSLFEPARGRHFTEETFADVIEAPVASARELAGASTPRPPEPIPSESATSFAASPRNKRELTGGEMSRALAKKADHSGVTLMTVRPTEENAGTVSEMVLEPITAQDPVRAPEPWAVRSGEMSSIAGALVRAPEPRAVRSGEMSSVASAPSHPDQTGMPEAIKPVSSVFTESKSQAESPRRIQVTIGRVEVRAVLPAPAAAARIARPAPGLTLERYLNRRGGHKL